MKPRGHAVAVAAVACSAAAFAAVLVGWRPAGAVDVPWAPTLGLRLDLALDGLGALYALLATGIGAAVFAFGAAYLPLAPRARGPRRRARPAGSGPGWCCSWASMVGLACARDLMLLFVFFDLTAVASYFLIGFDRDQREARGAALMALLVTGVSAVAMLIGAVLLYAEYGTFSLPELFDARARRDDDRRRRRADRRRGAGEERPGAAALLAAAGDGRADAGLGVPALGRDGRRRRARARPRASAAGRAATSCSTACSSWGWRVDRRRRRCSRWPGRAQADPRPLDDLPVRLRRRALRHRRRARRAGAAALYVLAHAIAKSALFMTAGAVTVATGETRLSHLGGLARAMPVLAVASGRGRRDAGGAAAHARLLQGRAVLRRRRRRGPGRAGAGRRRRRADVRLHRPVLARPVHGPRRDAAARRSRRCWSRRSSCWRPWRWSAASSSGRSRDLAADAADRHPRRPGRRSRPRTTWTRAPRTSWRWRAWAIGGALLLVPAACRPVVRAGRRAPATAPGPRRSTDCRCARSTGCRTASTTPRCATCAPASPPCWCPTGVLRRPRRSPFTPTEGAYDVGAVGPADLPIVALLVLAVAAARDRRRAIAGACGRSWRSRCSGFALAAVYAVVGAPDVALVAVVVETVLTLVFVGVFARLPPIAPTARRSRAQRRLRGATSSPACSPGLGAFATIWAALSRTNVGAADAERADPADARSARHATWSP